ncbi:MAG TPA: glycosyltransferase family 4 protein [Anaerolineales bacterium]|nr:glycosyltransferase family 4 protein [Anaerolineales bacterium]
MNEKRSTPLRVCYFGTYRAEYERNQMMIQRLERAGIEVVVCHATLWGDFEDREQSASKGWKQPAFWLRVIKAYWQLLRRYRQVGRYDVLMLGYPGQPDVLLGRILANLRRKPLVWDVFMSIYLIAQERGLEDRSPFILKFLYWLEKRAIKLPDLVILDIPTYAAWYRKEYGIADDKIRLIPIGTDDRIFHPDPERINESRQEFICLYYGTYIPNHGVSFIVEAARILEAYPNIQFKLVGKGPDRAKAEQAAIHYGLNNVTFIDWQEKPALIETIQDSDVILGTFGSTPQALMTMQHKIHEGLAMAKPVINGDSPAMRALLEHGSEIFLCRREDPQALAEAILFLAEHPEACEKLSKNGYAYYQTNLRDDLLSQRLGEIVRSIA